MATSFKTFLNSDIVTTKTLLHEAIPITGALVSGTYNGGKPNNVELNIKNYSHGMFQSVFDYPYLVLQQITYLMFRLVSLPVQFYLEMLSKLRELNKKRKYKFIIKWLRFLWVMIKMETSELLTKTEIPLVRILMKERYMKLSF